MTRGEKELLLKDLCARLFYGVKVSLNKNNIGDLTAVYPFKGCVIIENLKNKIPDDDFYFCDYGRFTIDEDEVKPYLRTMSNMTKKEFDEYMRFTKHSWEGIDKEEDDYYVKVKDRDTYIDWLLSHHFDYRDLIEKGLALEAPEGMYKIE